MIYLITDYGNKDYFVSAIKTVIFNFCDLLGVSLPRIIDITHSIESYNILPAILNIKALLDLIPNRSIILAIVDPEVGSNVKGCFSKHIFKDKEIYFVSRNNGILGALYPYKHCYTYSISLEKISKNIKQRGLFWKAGITKVSNTFHGRDIFAPISAILYYDLSTNSNLVQQFIDKKIKPLYTKIPKVKIYRNNSEICKINHCKEILVGKVIYSDKFGNLVTNIPSLKLLNLKKARIKILINGKSLYINRICNNYLDGRNEELFAVIDSFGYLEISKYKGSAKDYLLNFANIQGKIEDCLEIQVMKL